MGAAYKDLLRSTNESIEIKNELMKMRMDIARIHMTLMEFDNYMYWSNSSGTNQDAVEYRSSISTSYQNWQGTYNPSSSGFGSSLSPSMMHSGSAMSAGFFDPAFDLAESGLEGLGMGKTAASNTVALGSFGLAAFSGRMRMPSNGFVNPNTLIRTETGRTWKKCTSKLCIFTREVFKCFPTTARCQSCDV